MPDPTISEFMSRLGKAFVPGKAAGIDAVIQLHLTGPQAAEWYATIKDAHCTLTQGRLPLPNLTVSADSADFINIFSGRMDGMTAFMQGRLKITGDMGLALKLLGLFKMQ